MTSFMFLVIAALAFLDAYGGGDVSNWLMLVWLMYIAEEINYIQSLMGKYKL
jgi:hypothetical protein